MDIGRPATRPRQIVTQIKIKTYILKSGRGSTLIGNAPPTDKSGGVAHVGDMPFSD